MISDWQTFFVAILGVAGVLLGLLFVGISMNIDKIISSKALLQTAKQPMFLLLGLIILSVFMLIPGQSARVSGVEVVSAGLVFGAIMFFNDFSVYAGVGKSRRKHYITNIILNLTPFIFVVVSGTVVLIAGAGGIYFLIPAVILSLLQVATMSWALLVEINLDDTKRRWYEDESGGTENNT